MSSLSNLEELILLATGTLKGEAYGVAIHDRLHAAGMPSSLGAIYSTLERLEHKGFVTSELGEASPSRGGKRKRAQRQGEMAVSHEDPLGWPRYAASSQL